MSDKEVSTKIDNNNETHRRGVNEDLRTGDPILKSFDFGPSLMDEVFKELNIIKPEFTDDLNGQQKAINDCNSNVKNEIKEIVNKLTLNKDKSSKNKATVKPISPAEEQNLDSAIAMAKELATLSMMEFEFKPVADVKHAGENGLSDSPKTPTSPNKKKFSFKFKNSPKVERKNFSEKAENISDIQSILTEEAKVAYSSLIEKREGPDKHKLDPESKRHLTITNCQLLTSTNPSLTGSSHLGAGATITSTSANSSVTLKHPIETETTDLNPLRLLRNGFSIIPKVKGNKQRIAATPQTASLARLTANVNRSNLGAPPPPPASTTSSSSMGSILNEDNPSLFQQHNALPLPPRDRSKQFQAASLKQHQRKHPLIIPGSSTTGPISPYEPSEVSLFDNATSSDPPMSTFKPHLPALKHGICNDSKPSYVNYVPPPRAPETSCSKYSSPATTMSPQRTLGPHLPPKPNRTFLSEEPSEAKKTSSTVSVDNQTLNKPAQQFSDVKNYDTLSTQSSIKSSNCRLSSSDYATTTTSTTATDDKPSRTLDSKEPDPDEVRVMQKVLANEIQLSTEECIRILRTTGCDIHKAIKCVRLREILKSHSIDIDCNWAEMLARFNWNIRQASNYLIATQGLPEDTTEV